MCAHESASSAHFLACRTVGARRVAFKTGQGALTWCSLDWPIHTPGMVLCCVSSSGALNVTAPFEAEGVYGGVPYRITDTGQIEAMLAGGLVRFKNLEQLVAVVSRQDAMPSTGIEAHVPRLSVQDPPAPPATPFAVIPLRDDEAQFEHVPSPPRRIIDWPRAIMLTIFTPIFVLMGASQLPLLVLAVPVILVATAYIHFKGTYIDVDGDRLTYPMWLCRRSVRISEIQNINAESYTRTLPETSSGEMGVNYPKTRHRVYAANLSGEFGSRQIKFWSKRKRDQFFGYIEHCAPHVNITRWR